MTSHVPRTVGCQSHPRTPDCESRMTSHFFNDALILFVEFRGNLADIGRHLSSHGPRLTLELRQPSSITQKNGAVSFAIPRPYLGKLNGNSPEVKKACHLSMSRNNIKWKSGEHFGKSMALGWDVGINDRIRITIVLKSCKKAYTNNFFSKLMKPQHHCCIPSFLIINGCLPLRPKDPKPCNHSCYRSNRRTGSPYIGSERHPKKEGGKNACAKNRSSGKKILNEKNKTRMHRLPHNMKDNVVQQHNTGVWVVEFRRITL